MNDIGDLGTLISETIFEYVDDVKEGIDKATDEVAKETLQQVKEKAPIKTGKYKKSISSRTERLLLGNKAKRIYSKAPHYRLTHLLEHGHALPNGGRTRSFPHWNQPEEYAIKEYEERVKRVIEEGG